MGEENEISCPAHDIGEVVTYKQMKGGGYVVGIVKYIRSTNGAWQYLVGPQDAPPGNAYHLWVFEDRIVEIKRVPSDDEQPF